MNISLIVTTKPTQGDHIQAGLGLVRLPLGAGRGQAEHLQLVGEVDHGRLPVVSGAEVLLAVGREDVLSAANKLGVPRLHAGTLLLPSSPVQSSQ